MTAFKHDQDGTAAPSWSCLKAVINPTWHIPVPNVQWKTPNDGQRNCPKHVEFLDKNKFGKLVRLWVLLKKKFVTMHGHMKVKCTWWLLTYFECVTYCSFCLLFKHCANTAWWWSTLERNMQLVYKHRCVWPTNWEYCYWNYFCTSAHICTYVTASNRDLCYVKLSSV